MSSGSLFPEYYVLLGVPQSATTDDIRVAYKRESLKHVSFLPPSIRNLVPAPTVISEIVATEGVCDVMMERAL